MATNEITIGSDGLWAWLKSKLTINIWNWIRFWRPTWKQVIGAVLFFFMFWWVLQSPTKGLMLVGSMFAHEMGHGLVLAYGQIRYIVLFLFPLGAVAAPADEEENKKSDKLPANTLAWLMHAGLLVNIFLMGCGAAFAIFGDPYLTELGKELTQVNMMLAAFNIIPIWNLDAGQLFHIIFSSIDSEKKDNTLMAQLVVLALVTTFMIVAANTWQGTVLNALRSIDWVGFLLVSAIGIYRKSQKDDINYPEKHEELTTSGVMLHLTIWFVMVFCIFGLPVFNILK